MSSTLEQGEALQAAAYAEPAIHPHGLAMVLVALVSTLIGISTIIVALRTYTRAWLGRRAQNWGWEDTFTLLGYATFTCSGVFTILGAYYGLGTRDAELNVNLQVRSAEYTMYSNVIYGFSMPFIKASVLCTLLRITRESVYRIILFVVLFIACVMAIIGILATLLYCHPVRAYWNPLLGTCGNFMTVVKIGYAWTAIGIATDWIYAILPWFIIRKLQMRARTKATVMLILGLGAVASAATIVRAPYLQYYLADANLLYWNGHILMWSQIESGLAIIAASLPALRLLFQRFLEPSKNSTSGNSNGVATGYAHDKSTPMETLSAHGKALSSNRWKRIDDDNESSQHIVTKDHSYA